MNIQKIQDKINKKKQEIETLEKEIRNQFGKQISSEWLDVSDILPNCEVELNVHDKGKSWDELELKDREDQLLTAEQCIILANSKYAKQLKMDGSSSEEDFFINQPFDLNRKEGYVAWFVAYSGGSGFYCSGNPTSSNPSLGVRFIRKKIKGKKLEKEQ